METALLWQQDRLGTNPVAQPTDPVTGPPDTTVADPYLQATEACAQYR